MFIGEMGMYPIPITDALSIVIVCGVRALSVRCIQWR